MGSGSNLWFSHKLKTKGTNEGKGFTFPSTLKGDIFKMAMYSGYKKDEYVKNPKLRDFAELIMDVTSGHDHDGSNSKAVSVGTVSDLAVTNAKLATDVKIGSVAALTTTSKASVVGAINELDAEIGTLSGLSTSVKNTLVAAINEVDANADAAAASQAGMVTLTGTQNLTNKTLTLPKIDDGDADVTITSADQTHGSATVTIPDIGDAADTFVMNDTTATLTNKTLTSPVLTTPVIADGHQNVTLTSANQTDSGATVTIPDIVDSADEFVMKDTAQTLANKTLTSPVVTSPDLTFAASAHDYAAGHVDWTLSAAEAKTLFLTPTNADSGANILAPNTANKVFCVVNGSGQVITILVSGQTGVAVANGKAAFVRCNGTDYARLTGDA